MNERMAVVWRCKNLSISRPNGKPPKEGCGRWVYTWTSKRSGSKANRWLGKCSHCGKKRSLMGAVTATYFTKDEAAEHCEEQNRDEAWFLDEVKA